MNDEFSYISAAKKILLIYAVSAVIMGASLVYGKETCPQGVKRLARFKERGISEADMQFTAPLIERACQKAEGDPRLALFMIYEALGISVRNPE